MVVHVSVTPHCEVQEQDEEFKHSWLCIEFKASWLHETLSKTKQGEVLRQADLSEFEASRVYQTRSCLRKQITKK